MIFYKELSTIQLFEYFFDKDFSDITLEDVGSASEIDYGTDIGNEAC